jgi:hypothetical protein
MINKTKLITLLDHQEEAVRVRAVVGLETFFPEAEGVVSKILDSSKKYGLDNSTLLIGCLSSFLPTDNDLKHIVELLDTLDTEDEAQLYIYEEFINAIYEYPTDILERNLKVLLANENFEGIKNMLSSDKKVAAKTPEVLWHTLLDLCNKEDTYEFTEEEIDSAYIHIKYLSKFPKYVEEVFNDNIERDDLSYFLEEVLVELVGKSKLKTKALTIFDILNSTSDEDNIHDICIEALIEIGTDEVVDLITKSFFAPNVNQFSFLSILGRIPTSASEEFCVKLLKGNYSSSLKTVAAISALTLFSKDSIPFVTSLIEKKEYDPEICNLYEEMHPVLIYHSLKPRKDLEAISHELEPDHSHHDHDHEIA